MSKVKGWLKKKGTNVKKYFNADSPVPELDETQNDDISGPKITITGLIAPKAPHRNISCDETISYIRSYMEKHIDIFTLFVTINPCIIYGTS